MLDQQLALLGRLAEAGLEIAIGLERQAKGESEVVVAGDIAAAYARTARAVRFTIDLQSKLLADFQTFTRKPSSLSQDLMAQMEREEQCKARVARARRIVGRVIDGQVDAPQSAERMAKEAKERLRDDTLCDLSLPFSEIVAEICRHLGLSPDWAALSQEAWAREEIASGHPGEPLKTLAPISYGGSEKSYTISSDGRVRGPSVEDETLWTAARGPPDH